MNPTALADELERLAKAATEEPWSRQKPAADKEGWATGVAVAATYGRNMIYAQPAGGSFPSADADFIIFTRNHALAIAKLLRAGEEAEAALKMIRHCWAGHSEQCATVVLRPSGKCDCDWPKVADQCDSALAAYDAATQSSKKEPS